jgi:hypothetical protein
MQLKRLKNLLFIVLFMPIYLSAQTDDLDKLMTKRLTDCGDIAYNCQSLIPDYFRQEKMDSALLLAYWERKCGMNEEIYQTKFLFSILNRTFDDKTLTSEIFNEILQRNARKNKSNRYFYLRLHYFNPDTTFNKFIMDVGKQALTKNLTKTEAFLVKSYVDSTQTKLIELEDKPYNNTVLQSLYTQYKRKIFQKPEYHIGLLLGSFTPLGANKLLGNKFTLGTYLGYKFGKNNLDLALDFKFGSNKNTYLVVSEGKTIETKLNTSMYLGLEYGRILKATNKSEFSILTGAGSERMTTVYADKTTNKTANFLWSPNLSGGIEYKRHFTKFQAYNGLRYWALQARFNYMNFVNTGGTDVSGNGFSIRFIWGASDNQEKDRFYKN